MSEEDALKYDLGIGGLVDSDAVSSFTDSYNGLSSRPDWDGYLTLEEANDWYRDGNGEPLFVSLDKIDLSGIVSLGEYSVRAYSDTYNFDMKPWVNPINWGRNVQTAIGKRVAGAGVQYEINLYGAKRVKPILPWIK